jgi:alkanesulfonate monooxygenase SsuD/methylene tetrahydromethanopterin reductase-like flavin-dependent oxidoreductase (luciferase family)
MDIGVHLPLADLGQGLPGGTELRAYTAEAAALGFAMLSANDHLVWRRPWLDGPTSLAAVAGSAGRMTLATSIALPAVRHPVVLAKAIASLAVISFYRAEGLRLDPLPPTAPQVWFGSWGSDVRLRRMAEAADGWLASAYNTTPERFADARARMDGHLVAAGRDPATFPDAVATAWMFITHRADEAASVLEGVLAPLLGRDPEGLAGQLPVGSPEHCIELLTSYAAAGARRVLIWPVRDPRRQLELFAEEVRPYLPS